jgi:hypothetical protein
VQYVWVAIIALSLAPAASRQVVYEADCVILA